MVYDTFIFLFVIRAKQTLKMFETVQQVINLCRTFVGHIIGSANSRAYSLTSSLKDSQSSHNSATSPQVWCHSAPELKQNLHSSVKQSAFEWSSLSQNSVSSYTIRQASWTCQLHPDRFKHTSPKLGQLIAFLSAGRVRVGQADYF